MTPLCRPVADHGLLVEFGDRVDPAIQARVRQLDRALAERPFAGFVEAVPAYASLLAVFDPLVCDHAQAQAAVDEALADQPARALAPGPLREVLVCYDAPFAPDLGAAAEALRLSPEAVIEAHLAGDYSVALYGFAPGYAYLAGVPETIRLPRKPAPARDVPAGSVIIAGPQCLVTTLTLPTGWWIIGRSPTRILREADERRPFLFDIGDRVAFRRIGPERFADEQARA